MAIIEMDSSFTLGRVVHEVHMQVREAVYAKRELDFPQNEPRAEGLSRSFLVKSYFSSDIEVADRLLKKAIERINHQYSRCAKLVDVILDTVDPKKPEFTVNYVLELNGKIDEETVTRDDSFPLSLKGFDGYTFGQLIANNEAADVSVFEATSAKFTQPVAIKKFVFPTLHELNSAVREGVHQARAQHENTCRLLDMALRKDSSIFEFGLVMERMPRSLKNDIQLHVKDNVRYAEEELLRFLREIGASLLNAQKQNIAHCDIKPENIFVASNNRFVLGDFGSSWEMQLRSVTVFVLGTLGYMAPEVRKEDSSNKRPFPADIYSLGMTVLCMGSLGFPRNQELSTEKHVLVRAVEGKINELLYSEEIKALIRRMTDYNPSNRPSLQEVINASSTSQPTPKRKLVKAPQQPVLEPTERRPAVSRLIEESKQISTPILCDIGKTGIKFFNFQKCKWGDVVKLDCKVPWDEGTSYAIDNEIVYFFGNWSKSGCEAGKISKKRSTFTIESLPNMTTGRFGGGGIVASELLLVFGGIDSLDYSHSHYFVALVVDFDCAKYYLKSAEALSFSRSSSWTQLPEMSEGKIYITPVLCRGKLYLSGFKHVDVFDIITKCFDPVLPLQLPEELFTDRVTTLYRDELVIVTRTRLLRVNLASSHPILITSDHEEMRILPQSSAVMFGEYFFWSSHGKCKRASFHQPGQIAEF